MISNVEVVGTGAAVVAILVFLVQFLTRFVLKQQQVIASHILANTAAQQALQMLGAEQVKATREQTAVFQELLGYLKGQRASRG